MTRSSSPRPRRSTAADWIAAWEAHARRLAEDWSLLRLSAFDAFDARRLAQDAGAAQAWLRAHRAPWLSIQGACERSVGAYRYAGETAERWARRGLLAPGPLEQMAAAAEQVAEAAENVLASARTAIG